MAANEILPFSQGAGANVLTQAAYTDDPQRIIGHQPGIARAPLANKAVLQSSAVAAGVAQFLANFQGGDITDQLTPQAFSDAFKAALNAAGLFTTQAPGDQSTKPATCAFVQATVGAAINAGAVVHFPATAAPAGYVKLNGALLSRVTYANLYAFATTSGNMAASDAAWTSGQFSPGDGATTFRIPDHRGYHIRSWDDARGIDSGRGIGTVQLDGMPLHAHGVVDGGHVHGVFDPGHAHTFGIPAKPNQNGAGPFAMVDGIFGITNTYSGATNGSGTGIAVQSSGSNISISSAGSGSEARVKNIAMLACIKF